MADNAGEEAVGEIKTTLAGIVAAFSTAAVPPLVTAPTMTRTPSRSIKSCAASTASEGCIWLSRTANATGQPSTPPASFTCATANSADFSMPDTTGDSGPVSGTIRPILTGQVAAHAELLARNAKNATTRAVKTRRITTPHH